MGLCMLSRARGAVHGKQFVCAEFGIRAEKCQEWGSRAGHDETTPFYYIYSVVVVVAVVVVVDDAVVYLNTGHHPKLG